MPTRATMTVRKDITVGVVRTEGRRAHPAESLHRAYYGLFTTESEMRRRDHTGQVHVVILLRRCQTQKARHDPALWSFARSELKK